MSVEMSVEVASRQVDLPREAPSWAYAGAGRSRNSSVRNVIPIKDYALWRSHYRNHARRARFRSWSPAVWDIGQEGRGTSGHKGLYHGII